MSAVRPRLAATERRAAVLQTACRVFSQGSYRGTTTAEIAREAGVTEPILYRHFASKRDLYLAVLDESWRRLTELWEEAVASESEPSLWIAALGRAYPRQRVQQLEQQAVVKLGLRGSVAGLVHADERAGRALLLAEGGRQVRAKELRANPERPHRRPGRRAEPSEREHESAVRAFLRAAGR